MLVYIGKKIMIGKRLHTLSTLHTQAARPGRHSIVSPEELLQPKPRPIIANSIARQLVVNGYYQDAD